ncbi:MAG: hypothetical protein ACRY3E_04380 [Candidatus Lariskella arthropodorum]
MALKNLHNQCDRPQQFDYDTGLIKEAAAKYMQDVAIDISSIEYCQVL